MSSEEGRPRQPIIDEQPTTGAHKRGAYSMNFRWFRHQQREAELDAKIRNQLEMSIRDRIERGETPDQARVNARREFGNDALVKEVTREMWGWVSLEWLALDLRFGLRMLCKNPGFSSIAILTLVMCADLLASSSSRSDALNLAGLNTFDGSATRRRSVKFLSGNTTRSRGISTQYEYIG
jgi:hypothetical protein